MVPAFALWNAGNSARWLAQYLGVEDSQVRGRLVDSGRGRLIDFGGPGDDARFDRIVLGFLWRDGAGLDEGGRAAARRHEREEELLPCDRAADESTESLRFQRLDDNDRVSKAEGHHRGLEARRPRWRRPGANVLANQDTQRDASFQPAGAAAEPRAGGLRQYVRGVCMHRMIAVRAPTTACSYGPGRWRRSIPGRASDRVDPTTARSLDTRKAGAGIETSRTGRRGLSEARGSPSSPTGRATSTPTTS